MGLAKGSVINVCTILVSDNSADRTRGMNLMHSCYAMGALLCPFLIAAAAQVSLGLALALLAGMGGLLWVVYLASPLEGKGKAKQSVTDWSFLRSRPVLDAYCADLLPERRRAERYRLDGDLF